jgi:signal transduction histidine kinase/streptogramin lyase
MKQLTWTILISLIASLGFAQPKKIAFEKYNVAEGLPEEFAISLIQDDKGFIWAATQNGLVKYDGYQFKVYKYTSDENQTTNLQVRNLFGGLLKAKDGKIWMGAGSSIDRGTIASFDPVSEQFRHYYLPEMNHDNTHGISYLVHEDKYQNIWFGNLPDFTGNIPDVYMGRLNPLDGTIKFYPDLLMVQSIILPTITNTETFDGSVWMLDTQSNLKKWDQETDQFEVVIPGGKLSTASGISDIIRWISKANDKHLFLNGDHGICVYDVQNQKVIKNFSSSAGNEPGRVAGNIIYAKEDAKGHYWLMHQGGSLTRINPESGQIQAFVIGKGQLDFPIDHDGLIAFFMSLQNKNGIWFQSYRSSTTGTCFLYYDFSRQTFSFYNNDFNFTGNTLPVGQIFNFMEDRTGLLWLNTRPGMYKQAPKKRQMDLYRHRPNSSGSIPSDTIKCLFEDSKNRLWVGTRRGLALYKPDEDNFRVFRNDPANTFTLSNNNITAIEEDSDGKIWVGTVNGLNQWQESTGHFKRFFYNQKETNNCLTLLIDKEQRLWLSVRNKGVFILDKNSGEIIKSFIPDMNNPAAITSAEINTIYQDNSGNIWFGTNSRTNPKAGLFRLNQTEDGLIHYLPNPKDSTSISDRVIFIIAEDGKNRLWIGTNEGLNLYQPGKDHFTRFHNNTIFCISGFCLDKNGEPWFGTYAGSGLVSIDLQYDIITAYDETKGLMHNDIGLMQDRRIPVDDFGRFWLPTQRGLSVFDPETKSFVSYFEKDGFQPYSGFYISRKTINGDIWIGSNHGLNRIIPSELMNRDSTLPAVVVTQIKILDSLYSIPDGRIFKKSVAYTNGFELKHWQKDISFDFVALHYLRPEDNLYSWKLENYDKDWSAPSKERKASYTNLSPGKYVFRVKASNADGVWNEEGVLIAMTILPPWWYTWWAYAIYALLFVLALRGYSLWRLRHLRLEKEHLQSKVEERTSELKKSLEEIKSTQAQLIVSEKLASLGALTAGIAHEIQNPLNFVNNFAEVSNEMMDEMQEELTEGSRLLSAGSRQSGEEKLKLAEEMAHGIKKNLEKINHHGKRAESIVKGMLLHSRGSSGHKEPVDINAMCDEYLRLSYHGFRAKDKSLSDDQAGFHAEYKTDLDPGLPKINVVPQDIGRVLLNLINNAFYAANMRRNTIVKTTHALSQTSPPYNPSVTVTTKNLGNRVEISVKDNGNGIPEAVKDKIFQPFFTTKPTGQGTGLGLSLAYDIVKAHGGEIKVETIEGKGTEFAIQLPIT